MWVNPWGLWWDEVTASDVCAVDFDGNVVEGRWDVTPAIHIHTELHRRRPDARVVVHNHPYHVEPAGRDRRAARDRPPDRRACSTATCASSTSTRGEIDSPELGAELAEQIGDASVDRSWPATA